MTTYTKKELTKHVLNALGEYNLIKVKSTGYCDTSLSIDSFGWTAFCVQLEEELGTYIPCDSLKDLTNLPNCTPNDIIDTLFAAFQAQEAATKVQSSRKRLIRLPWGKRR